MPMSQIDMVALQEGEDGTKLQVCGDFKREPEAGNAPKSAEIHVVVQQKDIVVRGHDTCDFDEKGWEVHITEGEQLTPGPAIAAAVAIVEKENPAGLEMLSWVQPVEVLPPGSKGEEQRESTSPVFPEPETSSFAGGQLAPDHTVSSSLEIRVKDRDSVDPVRWRQEIEIRPVKHTRTVVSPPG